MPLLATYYKELLSCYRRISQLAAQLLCVVPVAYCSLQFADAAAANLNGDLVQRREAYGRCVQIPATSTRDTKANCQDSQLCLTQATHIYCSY